jgi:hypothetical protein
MILIRLFLFFVLVMKWTGFVKTLVKWCKQSGKTSSSSLFKKLGTPKIPKRKVKDPWTPLKQSWKPPNFRTIIPTLFPLVGNLQIDKKNIERL